jgi:hypothetical protein
MSSICIKKGAIYYQEPAQSAVIRIGPSNTYTMAWVYEHWVVLSTGKDRKLLVPREQVWNIDVEETGL